MRSNGIEAMELEMEPALGRTGKGIDDETTSHHWNPCHIVRTLWLLICAYADYYQGVTVTIMSLLVIGLVIALLDHSVHLSATKTHKADIRHDYSNIDLRSDNQFSKIDHWCLLGGDDHCRCDDPTMGISNEQVKGWAKAHKLNTELAAEQAYSDHLDVVFLGDAATEEWNGRWLGKDEQDLKDIKTYFQKTFSKTSSNEISGLALGIAGDTIANLRWRLTHGELTSSLNPKILWLLIGSNDLGIGQCSEEVVLLGIMKLAEELSLRKPGSIIVINSLLPRPKIKMSKRGKKLHLWPYIQSINEQLKIFCEKHESRFHYFDAHALFVNQVGGKGHITVKPELMSDGTHLTTEGHKVWGNAIVETVKDLKSKISAMGLSNGLNSKTSDPDDDFARGSFDDYLSDDGIDYYSLDQYKSGADLSSDEEDKDPTDDPVRD